MTDFAFDDEALPRRFWNKVRLDDDGCWIWIGAKASWHRAYGYYWHDNRVLRAHRVSYEALVGPIPEGLTLDHLCRRTECVNPAHLEAVTHKINVQRGGNAIKTHCVAGHPLTEDNVYRTREGWRLCRTCRRRRRLETAARAKAKQMR